MTEHPEVFISGTTRDLGGYRREIKDALLSLQIFPIEESSFTLAYGPLTEMLRALIGRCDAVIHLAGFSYGAEPPQRPLDQPRRSYTQIEYDVARQLGKPIYLFLAEKDCRTDESLAQTDEEKSLQMAHRQAIQTCGDIYYPFASIEEVASRVRELRFPARSAEAPRRVSNLPYNSLGPLFKGRDVALAELRQRLMTGGGRAVSLTARQAVHGLGGVGKTRLAIEYAWRQASDYENALLFVSARSPTDFRINLAALCKADILNLPEQNQPEEAARLDAVFRWLNEHSGWLNEHSGWLLILDNADTSEAAVEVEKTLPKLQGGGVIITSRIADWSAAVQTTELDVLGEQDAAAFLLERTEQRKKTATDTEDAAGLAHELGGLALALEQAGAYIAKNRFSFSEYRRRWESIREKVLAWYDERLMQYPSSVATTWQTTIDQLTLAERALLNMLAWLAPELIPVLLLEDVPVDGADARDALSGLVSWSLARFTADGDNFTIHRLVQEITRQRLSGNEKESALERALEVLEAKLPSADWDQTGWQLWDRLAPHCRTFLDRLRDHALEPKATRMMNRLAFWLTNRAEHNEAEPLIRRALEIDEKSYGPEHPNVARDLNNLAFLLKTTNRLSEAEPHYRRALEIDPNVATSLNNLAQLYRAQGRYTEAEPLIRRALEIDEKSYGPEHPNVAIRLNNLALLLQDTNRLSAAEPLIRRALEIDERSYGPEHPNIARDLNNLAQLLQDTNRLQEAEPLIRRALEIDEKSYGPLHPNVAIRLNNLGGLLHVTNRLPEAEPLYRRALAIDEKSLGPDHPNVARGLNNLALLLKATNRLPEAEPLMRRALEIDEKSYGPLHPNVAIRLNNLAQLLEATNRLSAAEPLMRRTVAILLKFTRSTGRLHPNLRAAFRYYHSLLMGLSLSQEEIRKRIAELGQEAGFDSEGYRKLLRQIFEQK